MMNYKICLLPGDGIGPEVIASAKDVLTALPIQWDFIECGIGFGEYQRSDSPLPDSTIRQIRHADATLFGAVTTPPNIPNYFSPVVRMRQSLELFSNLRPCRSIPHPSSRSGIDLIIVRENTEGLYSGIERLEDDGNRAITERVITRKGSERIIRKAFDTARQTGRKSVHVVHKANVLRQTCGLFRAIAFEIAKEYPEITTHEMLVDTCAMELVRAPEQFEVIVTTNLFGDILSDEACMFVGGLGVAASANIGADAAVFEPVHGSAPPLVGTSKANPIATYLAAAMLLDYINEKESAERLRNAVEACIANKESTPDLDGNLTTSQVTERVIEKL
ncbi:MAG: isocitrate/isopropylmalate dehydrogenase family protein [Anaerolineales bacterium]|uniref:isocitrate/isopropylmalate dehydrogenase family protein n=1 Tax=Candidatus Villigracilis proximus TaxID=3140683 RepID=UPI0031349EF8|nr:isocitrate/isopropylmalate dehydrogenase family protein [Anaerolineales bacterium]